ncbi:MAG: 30S ribosomal protein S9 [Owenweeksia sp.]|nr:30S ribosomal protein S9 [Owenweeksia sp.]
MEVMHKIGRRKTSIARIFLNEGTENITINNKDAKQYFSTPALHYKLAQAFELTETKGQYDVKVNVDGGGISGQAEAVRLAIARALCDINPEYRGLLKPEGLMTRDPRMVERKKFGQKKSVKFQFSKR